MATTYSQGVVVSPRLAAFQARLATMHAHFCPRQVLGLRMGLYAGELLALEVPRDDKRLFVFVELDGCLADAVSVSTGAWLGHRTLRLVDHGKTAATFVDVASGRAIRIRPHAEARQRAATYAPGARDRWHAQRDGYQVMPVDELLVADRVVLKIDLERLISTAGHRVSCTACGEEIVNEREILADGRPRCRACTGEAYVGGVRQ
ncbi:MAG TPA: FmdE family protein [Candidatus Limnocylindria bacterium]|nr:FmdE family protein [Candidatus Limnocylindria bacterium]